MPFDSFFNEARPCKRFVPFFYCVAYCKLIRNGKALSRHSGNTIRYNEITVIPFESKIRLPDPRYARTITQRDALERIIRSSATPEGV